MKKYPAIKPKRHTGTEPFISASGATISTLQDFWSWAYSDLIGNTQRGDIAEYLVACALGVDKETRITWNRYDLLSPEGIRVEVKSAGYIQSWGQDKLSAISFSIPKTHGWDNEDGVYEDEVKRQADVYVFCLHKHEDQETINPLDTTQWEFYVVPTRVLNDKYGDQKSISLYRLREIGAVVCRYEELHDRIVGVAHPVMKVRFIGESDLLSLIHGKVYEVISVERDCYRVIDETGEDYLYDPGQFEKVNGDGREVDN